MLDMLLDAAPIHDGWKIGFAASTITGISFFIISVLLARSLAGDPGWRQNHLALGTSLIFFSCAGGHLIHSAQMLYPALGVTGESAYLPRVHFSDWHLWIADGITAIAGIVYVATRQVVPGLVSGSALYEDLTARHRRAMTIHDQIVQRLAAAKWELDLGSPAKAKEELDQTIRDTEKMLASIERVIAESEEASRG